MKAFNMDKLVHIINNTLNNRFLPNQLVQSWLIEYAQAFNDQQEPTERFHRDLWCLVRDEINQRIAAAQ